jgi:hypothetical protein
MHLPPELKIGAHDVKLVVASSWDKDTGNSGEWDTDTSTIYIRAGMTDSLTFATLLHEAMHVMNATMSHELLDSLSEQMTQFLWDNDLFDE